ncbi:MAG: hypothetical protein QGH85_02710 [Candidatus Pacebacteria bacterium]|jgi:uncharacterized protein YacL|nr:hypothetical protein [Parcubacteria group bacterium]MDP6249347.1 hypothetical protein [Candidatus Paceibacterota bacterium]MDP7159432.1 hypothetical protein [Candidatus Paceibacterota bacterium]MDP7366732.1 hypothetical protein [Candidatus Paceibacterota bacterium]MDP7466507.1 hypothetical protein [Candidatus Paceibacterota bacterium]|tara:strand:- start:6622 stop:7005 length:384 start_codon:yes stop_codon:yes gene_type:complete
MTPIEIIALVVAIVTIIKILVVLKDPSIWMRKISLPVLKSGTAGMVVSLVLAALVLRYLLESLTIVEIYAVTAFVALLIMTGFMAYPKKLATLMEQFGKDKHLIGKSWLQILIWLALSIWVLKELFF